jgi:hypothetical protein
MARYRNVQCRIWSDKRFKALSDEGKLLFLYVLTHPQQTSVGAFRATAEGLAAELGWKPATVSKRFQECSEMVSYDPDGPLVALPNFLDHNKPANGNVVKGWRAAFDDLPECDLRSVVWQAIHWQSLKFDGAFATAFATAFGDLEPPDLNRSETVSKPSRIQKQKQNKKQIQKQEQKNKAAMPPIPAELDTPEFNAKWQEWIDFRRTYKRPVNPPGAKTSLGRLAKCGPAIAIATIDNSIANDWQGLFPEKLKNVTPMKQTQAAANRAMGSDDARRKQIAEMEAEWVKQAEEEEANNENAIADA